MSIFKVKLRDLISPLIFVGSLYHTTSPSRELCRGCNFMSMECRNYQSEYVPGILICILQSQLPSFSPHARLFENDHSISAHNALSKDLGVLLPGLNTLQVETDCFEI